MTVEEQADTAPPAQYSPKRWATLAVTLFAVFMDMVDNTVLNVALPAVQQDLDASSAQLEWSVAGYTLAFAAAMITGARLGDQLGRRRIYLIGLGAFVVTSALAGAAVNPEMLIASRILQGGAAALMVPQVLAMLQVDFPKSERPKAMSMYGMSLAVGGIGGPLLGGVLLEADLFGLGWRPVFYVNVPVGLAALVAAAILTRESRVETRESFDIRGTLIATVGLISLLFPLVQGRELDWPWWTFALMIACPVILWLFVRYEHRVIARGESPIIDPALLHHRSSLGGLLVAILFFCGMAYQLVLTVHLQTGEGYSPIRTAVALVTFTVGVGIGSAVAPQLMPLGRRVVLLGCAVMAVGMGVITWTVDHWSGSLEWWHLAPGMIVSGIGLAMVAGTLLTIVLAQMPKSASGAASSLINTAIQIGVATGVAIVGTVYFTLLEDRHTPTDSAVVGLLTVVGLYTLAGLLALVLPPGRVDVSDVDSDADTDADSDHHHATAAVGTALPPEAGAKARVAP
ncbi:MFS transporter [Streptomyces phaeochromogenes]|uniref:AlnT1 transporter n=1 Tax=Streptomyces sp. CM020 TaxID=569580 RepID=B6SEG9_9ACTN|nr:AlnT1 transporter [Streptomyces sp. CM020]WSW14289.1 MFS transporter [Streptomyces phaeochromogenes]WTA07135.1 MFS transporter [Streptomyces phaeochromogenes]